MQPRKTHCTRGHERTTDNIGKSGQCKLCSRAKSALWRQANPELAKAHMRQWRVKHPNAKRKWDMANPDKVNINSTRSSLKKYGLTVAQFADMSRKQDNACAICERVFDTINVPHVDHSHGSVAQVRGLLCRNCNIGLGMFQDKATLLVNATQYLCNQVVVHAA